MASFKRLTFLYLIILMQVLFEVSVAQTHNSSDSTPYLSELILNGDSVITFAGTQTGSAQRENNLILDYRTNNIKFRMAPPGDCEYQFFLKGFDRKWTQWDRSSSKEYTNLPAGEYTLMAKYRESCIGEKTVTLVSFIVQSPWYSSKTAFTIYVILFFLLLVGMFMLLKLHYDRRQRLLEQLLYKKSEELLAEKHIRETLLGAVLPKNTASEIMVKGKADKVKYNFVTVLFSDIQGFTKIAEEMNPELLIDELDKFFFHFDSVVEKYGIEKIKTIGDAYMCAGGIPEKNRTNPVEVILAALEMQTYMTMLKQGTELEGMKYWDIRIGIHTGTVVAGVIGQRKLSYDIWGDTVNIASRMESSGEGGKINISGTTYEFIKEFFDCEFRGKMPV